MAARQRLSNALASSRIRFKSILADRDPSRYSFTRQTAKDIDIGGPQGELGCATYASLLRQCGKEKALLRGKLIHSHISGSGYDGDKFLGNLLVQMYGNCGSIEDARSVFDQIQGPNSFTWNIMINAYAQNGHMEDAMLLFKGMPEPNVVTWNSMVAACARNGLVQEAKSFFDRVPEKNLVSWNAMIAAYAENGHGNEALQLFRNMNLEGFRPGKATFVGALDACAILSDLPEGRFIEANVVEAKLLSDLTARTALVDMYGKCGSWEDARRVYELPLRDEILWTAMLSAYARNGCLDKARACFDRMPHQNVIPCTIMISAHAQNGHVQDAKDIFHRLPHQDALCCTTMLSAYAQQGYLQDARNMFDLMKQRDGSSWSAMIAAYAQNGHAREALKLFQLMDIEGEPPTTITFSSIFDACADPALIAEGKAVHNSFMDAGLRSDVVLGTSVVNMYGRCGSLENARSLFDAMQERNVFTWTAMVAAYAQNGYGNNALTLFQAMQLDGVQADEITFTNIIYACGQAGLFANSCQHFRSITQDHNMELTLDHCKSMVDLLGRAGKLEEAEDLINNMPFQPDPIAWTSLLSGCRLHGDEKRGARAAQRVMQLEPENGANYVLLSNIYIDSVRR